MAIEKVFFILGGFALTTLTIVQAGYMAHEAAMEKVIRYYRDQPCPACINQPPPPKKLIRPEMD